MKVLSKNKNKAISSKSPSEESVVNVVIPVEADRVNNINQKEAALYLSGVTRRKVYDRIGELLDAKTKVKVGCTSVGEEIWEERADLGRRKEGCELAMRAFGDSKEFLAVNTQVNNVLDVKSIIEAINRGSK